MRLLVICPSRGRPQILKRMIESFERTASFANLIILLDDDDEYLKEYIEVIDFKYQTVIGVRDTNTNIINNCFNTYKYFFDYFSVTNDDFIFHTENWDEKLIKHIVNNNNIGIAYGNDLLQKERLPTMSIVSSNIVRALGWLQMPTLCYLYGDNVWKIIGIELNIIFYDPDVYIEHRHFCNRSAPIDKTYLNTNSQLIYKIDGEAFTKWFDKTRENDISNIRNIIQIRKPL